MEGNEILAVVDSVSNEKGLEKQRTTYAVLKNQGTLIKLQYFNRSGY